MSKSVIPLGKPTHYPTHYQPELLYFIPRQAKRDELLIGRALPFHGQDIWTAYEISWLTAQGKPCVAIAELFIDADSDNIVESKSLKLYLNSLNQCLFDSQLAVQNTIYRDLKAGLGGELQVTLYSYQQFDALCGLRSLPQNAICLDEQDITIEHYQYTPAALKSSDGVVEEVVYSHLLKSNCLITNQPDWASIWIKYQGPQIEHQSLLRYLISFREHNEFHEQCVERIFCDIQTFCKPIALTVYARYVRRGGIDINPLRTNDPDECIDDWLYVLSRQ